jgi:hypothetical protein
MNTITKIIGWTVLLITELMAIIAFITMPEQRASVLASQLIIFGTVWAAVFGKNIIDLKRDQIPESIKGE